MKRSLALIGALALCLSVPAVYAQADLKQIKAEGAELYLGGVGMGHGKFGRIDDLVFDGAGNLYVLDGLEPDRATNGWKGNALVQKFDGEGKFLDEFSVRNAALEGKDQMARLAVDSAGRSYVTKPEASVVEQYGADGKLLASIEFPGATGVTIWRRGPGERVAVLGGHSGVVNRKRVMLGGESIALIDRQTAEIDRRVTLSVPLVNVVTLTSDAAGNFYALADVKQVYQFDPDGKLLQSAGSALATRERVTDGSQLTEGLAVDSQGNIAAGSWGDVALFDAGFQTVSKRPGRFSLGSAWENVRLAFDPHDHLWVASVNRNGDRVQKNNFYVDKPAIVRLVPLPEYYSSTLSSVTKKSTQLLGFSPQISTAVPSQVAHDLKPFPLDLVVPAAQRRMGDLEVRYHLLDAFGKEVDHGAFPLPLRDGEEARHSFTVQPAAQGWYAVVVDFLEGGKVLTSKAQFIGVSPAYAGMGEPTEPNTRGSWVDASRQIYCGLPLMRLHPAAPSDNAPDQSFEKGLAKFEGDLAAAEAAGATYIVQLSSEQECKPEFVRAVVSRFKGRVPVYEIYNEPNISLKGGLPRYVEIWKTIAAIIRELDPQAKLMGPATVNIDLKWIGQFFDECAPLLDMVSVHDYEGHNTYDPTHWNYKFGELRQLMAAHGLADKPLWQTERATGGVMRSNFSGLHQAVILTYHYDLLQTLGIPPEHNAHYYLNEGGYQSVATYVWSKSGPHPAALALRTRYALTRGRKYEGTVDFGPNGNKVFLGLRFGPKDGDGGLVLVRNLGTLDTPLELEVTGAPVVHDAFDNVVATPAKGGRLPVTIGQLPMYIELPAGATLAFPKWDWGHNFAAEAKFTYSAEAVNPAAPVRVEPPPGVVPATPEDAVVNPNNLRPELLTPDPFKILVNGIMETHHSGDPNGGTGKTPQFRGELPSFPQTLEMTFPTARPIAKLAIFGERGDNTFCALLEYDLQAWLGGAWQTVAEARAPFPISTVAEAYNTTTITWQGDPNFFVHQFAPPIVTDKLRLVVRRTTFGFAPDDGIRKWSEILKPQLILKEIEVY